MFSWTSTRGREKEKNLENSELNDEELKRLHLEKKKEMFKKERNSGEQSGVRLA